MLNISIARLIDELRRLRLLEPAQWEEIARAPARADPKALAAELLRRDWLTPFQVNQLLQGKGDGLVLGPYVLLERLGEGGMGQVFKANNRKLGKVVALKLIRKDRIDSPDALRRFHREIEAAAQLDHPNIVRALDAGEADGAHFFAMEYVAGTDLEKQVRRHGPLPLGAACAYIRQAALGLQHAHERGMVHRDIKPSNLLLDLQTGSVRILDMGLARLSADRDEDRGPRSTLTREGVVMGTLDYLAPEQAEDSHGVDIRADLYSLGCTLYFLLTRQAPFAEARNLDKLYLHRFVAPRPVETIRPEVPPGLSVLLRKLLAKRPEERYQTPAELADALASWDGRDVTAPGAALPPLLPAPAVVPPPLPSSEEAHDTAVNWSSLVEASPLSGRRPRRRWPWVAAAGLLLVAAAGLSWFLLRPRPNDPEPGPTPEGPTVKETGHQRYLAHVASLLPDEQLRAVERELKARNPEFTGKVTGYIRNRRAVTSVSFPAAGVTDLSPLQALPALEQVACTAPPSDRSPLTDLSPLKGMKLTYLDIQGSRVTDLSPLAALPLTRLNIGFTNVSDLSPLSRLPLTYLDCRATLVKDLSPLKKLPLDVLHCSQNAVTDLTPLRGMKLTELSVNECAVRDLSPLAQSPLTTLWCESTLVTDLSPLHNLPLKSLYLQGTLVKDLVPLGRVKLNLLHLSGTKVVDLAPLEGMPLAALYIQGTAVKDLTPLQGAPLTVLDCNDTAVTDLGPLRDSPLTLLWCKNTRVSSLEPLRGMRLKDLRLAGTSITDLAPLDRMPLTDLDCSRTGVKDLAPLRRSKLVNLDLTQTRVADLSPLRGLELDRLECGETAVADLTPLASMQSLRKLSLSATPIKDLERLRGLKLEHLSLTQTTVSDLSPLRGMPLRSLIIQGTRVQDLSPLRGMELTEFNCLVTPVEDLAPLANMPLTTLLFDATKVRDLSPLKTLNRLLYVNGKSPSKFWKEVESRSSR